MKKTLLVTTATAALLLIGSPPPGMAQTTSPDPAPQGSQAQQPPASRPDAATRGQSTPMQFTRVQIRTAADLTGRPLFDAVGGVVGEVDYLLIDAGNGKVRFAVVGRGGVLDLGEELIAVPWEHIKTSGTQGFTPRIDAFMEDLEDAPRLTWSTLREITEPNFVMRVTDYFAPIVGTAGAAGADQPRAGQSTGGQQTGAGGRQAGLEQQRDQSAPQAQQQPQMGMQQDRQQAETRAQQDQQQPRQQAEARAQQGQQQPQNSQAWNDMSPAQKAISGSQRERQQDAPSRTDGGQQGQQQPQPQQAGGQGQQQAEAGGQQQRSANGFLLVGRSIVTTLGPPAFNMASELRGAEVVANDGSEIGEIEQLMIDVDRGRVAYVTIAQGGFLGLGETLKAVPLQALEWQAPETFRLSVPKSELDKMPKLTGDEVPYMVRRSHLEQLYQQFGLRPYWQQS